MLRKFTRFCSCTLILSFCILSMHSFSGGHHEESVEVSSNDEIQMIQPLCNLEGPL